MFIKCVLISIVIGLFIGWYIYLSSKQTFDEESVHPKYRPSINEILSVLNVIYMSYRCSPHEKECIEEAIRIFEEMALIKDNEEFE